MTLVRFWVYQKYAYQSNNRLSLCSSKGIWPLYWVSTVTMCADEMANRMNFVNLCLKAMTPFPANATEGLVGQHNSKYWPQCDDLLSLFPSSPFPSPPPLRATTTNLLSYWFLASTPNNYPRSSSTMVTITLPRHPYVQLQYPTSSWIGANASVDWISGGCPYC